MREQSAAEPGPWARAGEKGMVECQCRGDIVAALPRLEWAAIDSLWGGGGGHACGCTVVRCSGRRAGLADRGEG